MFAEWKPSFRIWIETFHRQPPNGISHCENGEQKPPKPPLPLARRVPPSNTAMPRPTACTTPNCSSDSCVVSHMYAIKSPFVTMARPKFVPKSTPSCGPIPNLHYLLHPWTRPSCDAKGHPDPIRRFSTMHWTDRRTYGQTGRQIVHGKVWWL